MAQILLTTLADALGGAVPTTAVLEAQASRARSAGATVTAPKRVVVRITDGVPDAPVELDASGADWYWKITVNFPTAGAYVTRYVAVPSHDVEWADLVDIDRATMQPDPGAVPAWTVAVAQVQALIDNAQTDVEEAVGVAVGVQVPVAVADAVTVQVDPKVQQAEDARAGAVSAAERAEAVPAQVDTAMADQVGTGGEFDTKLSAAIGALVQPVADEVVDTAVTGQDIPGKVAIALAAQAGKIVQGVGMPNGVVTAAPGTLYVDTASTMGASVWRKASGGGATVWSIVSGDTGWRDIKATLIPDTPGQILASTALIRVRRTGPQIEVLTENLRADASGVWRFDLPFGFRPGTAVFGPMYTNSFAQQMLRMTWNAIGNQIPLTASGVTGRLSYSTTYDWPTVLPGTPA